MLRGEDGSCREVAALAKHLLTSAHRQRNGAMTRKVIIDCDPGIDDAVALCLALFEPRLDVVAVTAVEGVVTAPRAAGRYLLQWDMVEEGVCWFAERDPSPEAPLPIRVVPAPPWGPLGSAAVSALLAAVALVYARREDPGWPGAVAARGDLLWLPLALGLKQGVVLGEAGEHLREVRVAPLPPRRYRGEARGVPRWFRIMAR